MRRRNRIHNFRLQPRKPKHSPAEIKNNLPIIIYKQEIRTKQDQDTCMICMESFE